MFIRLLSLACIALLGATLLSACSEDDSGLEANYPKGDARQLRRISRGSLIGGEGGFAVGGNSAKEDESSKSPLGVNGFLWRATLDTLSFMPLASADPFGGTILTDWYEDPKTPGVRYKVNAIILDKTLRADGVRVSVFKQKLEGVASTHPVWRDLPVDTQLAHKLEDQILTRARQLRITQIGH